MLLWIWLKKGNSHISIIDTWNGAFSYVARHLPEVKMTNGMTALGHTGSREVHEQPPDVKPIKFHEGAEGKLHP